MESREASRRPVRLDSRDALHALDVGQYEREGLQAVFGHVVGTPARKLPGARPHAAQSFGGRLWYE